VKFTFQDVTFIAKKDVITIIASPLCYGPVDVTQKCLVIPSLKYVPAKYYFEVSFFRVAQVFTKRRISLRKQYNKIYEKTIFIEST